MDDFLILLQAKLDEAKSKGNVNADIDKLQSQLDKLKVQVTIDPKSISDITNQMSKLGIQVGQDFGKAFNNGLSGTIDKNVLSQINKISDSSASTIVQNEKKKQEAYKATSDAVVYHAGVISKLNKAETNGRFYGSSRGTGYFGTGHYFVDSKTKHELDNNSSYSKLPYTSVDISKYDNLFKATTDEVASKLHNFLENLTRFTQGSDRFNIDELFSQFKNVFTDTTMDIKDFGDKMEQLKTFMSNSNLSDRSDSVSTQFMKSLGYGGVDTRGTKYADTRYGTVIYDLKEESVLQANITDELQKQGQMLEKINYEKGQVFDSAADAKIQEQIDAQRRLAEVQAEFRNSFNTDKLDKTDSELTSAKNRLSEINDIISNCQHSIENATAESQQFAKEMKSLGLNMTESEIAEHAKESTISYKQRIEELSLERAELEKRIPILEENYNKESQLASEAYKQAEQIVEQRRLEAQQSSSTTNEVIQNEEKKQHTIQESIKLQSELASFNEKFKETGIATINNDGVVDMKKSLEEVRNIYSDFGKVTIKNEMSDLVKGTEQFRVSIESSNGELKRTESFLMKLSEDGKSFVFADDMIRSSESTVRHLNEQQEAANKVILEEEKLANAMADVREKSEQARQAEEKRQELAQNRVINKALEDEYKQRQKLTEITQKKVNEIQLSTDIDTLTTKYQKFGVVSKEVEENLKELKTAREAVLKSKSNEDISSNVEKYNSALKKTKSSLTELTTQEVSLSKRISQMDSMRNWMLKNQAAVKLVGAEVDKLIKECETCDSVRFEGIKREFRELQTQAREAGKLGNSLLGSLKEQFAKFTQWFSVTSLTTNILHTGKRMYDAIYDIDTAMTNLYKVTDETEKKYTQFLGSASNSAQNLGRSISSLVEQTANWAKLGFNIDEASKLAEISSIYANVGEVDDDTAVSDIVTVMKAYDIAADDSIQIVDKYNKLGNEFATSAKDLGEGLSNSASMLAMGGTDINKALALLTGGAEITQSAGELGNALKIGQMRVQGMKGALEELGEEVDEDVESISKMQTHVLNLTKGKVNIFDENKNFKDYYDILEEVSKTIDELSATDRADLLETLFGKNRANQGAAVIQAFQSGQVQKALEATMNAEGSAMQEQERWLGSLEAKTQQFEAQFQSLSKTVLDSDLLKNFVDLGTTGVSALEGLVKVLGKIVSFGDNLNGLGGTLGAISGLLMNKAGIGERTMFQW